MPFTACPPSLAWISLKPQLEAPGLYRKALKINGLLVHVLSSKTNSLDYLFLPAFSNVGGLTFGEIDLINCVLYVCYSRYSRRNFGVVCFGCCGRPVSVSSDGVVIKVVFWKNTVRYLFSLDELSVVLHNSYTRLVIALIVVASCDVRLYDDSSSNPSVCVGFL